MCAATAYPSSLGGYLNEVPEDIEAGAVTPSHGGTVHAGHEYDLPIHQPPPPPPPPSATPTPRVPPPPTPRAPTPSSPASADMSTRSKESDHHRARPVSMPPQANGDREKNSVDEREKQRSRDPSSSKSRSSNRVLGDYTLSKTLGAGSMGKVKLAHHNITGEKFAVKILPRASPSSNPNPTPEAAAKQASKDASKEIRILREAALSMLLHHPYICGMREMIVHPHHYYMVNEYVNGGQMLDYIISHGRLRERVARKFARQIGSALDYCHRNNVVHRDLKIENILISQTGNIKIIDFGLSNLYDPQRHLGTFCGSLYFAAPELLNAKVYTGPEVDVWSFGVVLYVLVCGKVPFDDQSMPALHAKIKRGLAEYPVWLSAECKHLLSRMLVTNPAARATLHEVLTHPWMLRGFTAPPDPHMVKREPLRADELDKQVIRNMKTFEFGTDEDVEKTLREVVESEAYARAVGVWERRREGGRSGSAGAGGSGRWESFSTSSVALSYDSSNKQHTTDIPSTPSSPTPNSKSHPSKSKRFSGFDFYRRKFFSPTSSPSTTPSHSPPTSQSHLSSSSLVEGAPDPTGGFHPLVSMYFLVREKLERERVYGPGHFASSQVSLEGPSLSSAPAPTTAAELPPMNVKPPSQPAVVQGKKEKDVGLGGAAAKADYSMPLPRLPAPETSHYSGMSYDVTPATPSPTAATFHPHPQPRPRDAGGVSVVSPGGEVAAGLPRAPPESKHRRSHSLSQRPAVGKGWFMGLGVGVGGGPTTAPISERGAAYGGSLKVSGAGRDEPPRTAGPELTAFVEKMDAAEKEREGGTIVKRFGSLIGRAGAEEGRKEREKTGTGKRGSILGLGAVSPRPSDVGSEKEREREVELNEKSSSSPPVTPTKAVHRRAATILDPQGRSARHERRSSMGNSFFAGGTIGRHRRPSTGFDSVSVGSGRRRGEGERGAFGRTEEVDEGVVDGEREREREQDEMGVMFGGREGGEGGEEKEFKPVFMKGLFSVATTSTKPPGVIKADIRRVLDRMSVQYRETRSGFECIHLPSIDISSVNDPQSPPPRRSHHRKQNSGDSSTRRSVAKKASKLSFATTRSKEPNSKGKEREPSASEKEKEKEKDLPSRPSGGTVLSATASSGSSSFFNVSSNAHTIISDGQQRAENNNDDDTQSTVAPEPGSPSPPSRSASPFAKSKILPPIPRDFAATPQPMSPVLPRTPTPLPTGELDRDLFETIGTNTLAVRFEINIVKVPWIPLHGIQFRRICGDGWQYQMLARRVLTELKL